MKLDEMSLKDRPKFMNMNKICVFIPISDPEGWADWDGVHGYGGANQLDYEGGIITTKEWEKEFRTLVAKFEKEWDQDY